MYALIAVFFVSLVSFAGIITLVAKRKLLDRWLTILVAFAAGTLLGTAFFDLIPESFEATHSLVWVLVGIVSFYVLESVIHWHHSHTMPSDCHDCVKPVAYLNVFSDGIHNLLDGVIIAASFVASVPSGIAVTIAILLHEIPQEIGDFAVLVKSGLSVKRALLFNFISSSLALLGMFLGFVFLKSFELFVPYTLGVAAGGFIYIAAADLFPELHKETDRKKTFIQTIVLVLGMVVMYFVLGPSHAH